VTQVTGRALRRWRAPAAVFAAVVLAAGCASTGPGFGDPTAPYADLLEHPLRLRPAPDDRGALVWQVPDAELRQYRRIALERIQVRLADDAAFKSVDPADLKALVDYFHQAIVKALGDRYPIADAPGPDVLRVRIVIFDLVPTRPEVSAAVFLTPYAMVPDLLSGPATGRVAGSAPYLGRTGIAVQFRDGETGREVGEYADTRFGRKYVVDTSQGVLNAATTGIGDYLKAFSTWDYAKQAFDQWAALFRARLDRIHETGDPAAPGTRSQ
jgi:hypothetical protein